MPGHLNRVVRNLVGKTKPLPPRSETGIRPVFVIDEEKSR